MAIRRTDALIGTAAELEAVTGVFADGQLVIDTTNNIMKMGDGTSLWSALPELGGDGGVFPDTIDGGTP